MVRQCLFSLILLLLSFYTYSQDYVKIQMERVVDTAVSTISHSLHIPKGSWKNTYGKQKLEDLDCDSAFFLHAPVDYFQTIFQAFKREDMSRDFLENQIAKWGLDTLELTPITIRSYISALIAYQNGEALLIIDSNNNGSFSDDRILSQETVNESRTHTILYERYRDGKIIQDSLTVYIENVNFRDKIIRFKFVEKREGYFQLEEKRYKVTLEALLNDYDFSELSTLKIDDQEKIIGEFSLNHLISIDGSLIYQVFSISKNGEVIELKRYEHKKLSSLQIGNFIPSFSARNINGNIIHIDDFKGKYALVYFWNSACAGSTYLLKEHVDELISSNQDLTLLSIALDKLEHLPLSYVEEASAHSLIVESANGQLNQIFQIKIFPTYYLINPNGKILLKSERGVDTGTFRENINKAIRTDRDDF